MGLETTSSIAGLNASWPLGGDDRRDGDNHIRQIKSVLKTIFPGSGGSGFSTPIIATETEINYISGITGYVQDQIDTKAPIANPTFTGVPYATTADPDTNTSQIATTAFVVGQAGATTPTDIGTSSDIGVSLKYARADHTHGGLSLPVAASQTEMEAASSSTVFATPGNVKYAPMVAKAWAYASTIAPGIVAGYNAASITVNSTGDYTITFTNELSSISYCAVVTTQSATVCVSPTIYSLNKSNVRIRFYNASNALASVALFNIVVFGDF